MLASINPLGERSRNRTSSVTYAWFVAGSVIAGALLGALLGGPGALLFGLLEPTTTAVAIVAMRARASFALAFELHVGDLPLPTVRRQVDEDWIPRYRAWVYAGGFGFQLGFGVVTVVTTSTVYLTWAFAVLTGSVAGGVVIGVVFGLARALPVLLVARADTPGRLRDALQRFTRWAPATRRRGHHGHRARPGGRRRPRPRRHRMTDLSGHGVTVTLPTGWEGRLFRRPAPGEVAAAAADGPPAPEGATTNAVVHLATIPLPTGVGDFASGAVDRLGDDDTLIVVFEYDAASATEPLFAREGFPRVLEPATSARASCNGRIRGQAGAQVFFHDHGRAFCLYVVLGAFDDRVEVVAAVNAVLATLTIDGGTVPATPTPSST